MTLLAGCVNEDSNEGMTVAPTAAPKPNIILIVVDTARADHFSAYGYDRPTTPNIDALARDSVRFSNAHSVAPWTLPAHMSMFTGLLPGQHGATWEAFPNPPDLVSRRFQPRDPDRLLTSRLKAAGYRTWGISSNPWVGERMGFDTKFDTFTEVWRGSPDYPQFYAELPSGLKIDANFDQTRTGKAIVLFKHKFITDNAAGPFFAFFNFMDTHYSYVPPAEFVYKFDGDPEVFARISAQPAEFTELALLGGYRPFDLKELIPFYDAELSYVDFMIGKLIDWLRGRNLYDETLIIVTSDHGEHLGEKGRFSHQLSIEQELLSVPLIIKYPGSAHAGIVIDNPLVSNIDVYETIIAAAIGASVAEKYDSFSEDLTQLIAHNRMERQQLISESYFSDGYLSQIKLKYPPFDESSHRVVRRAVYAGDYKIMFENLRQTSVAPVGKRPGPDNRPPDPATISATIQAYTESLNGSVLQRLEPTTEDRELIERLQSLGYIDSETQQAD
jgi:arylsulfatase A-like enzyme